jgi:hypothetical protein
MLALDLATLGDWMWLNTRALIWIQGAPQHGAILGLVVHRQCSLLRAFRGVPIEQLHQRPAMP